MAGCIGCILSQRDARWRDDLFPGYVVGINVVIVLFQLLFVAWVWREERDRSISPEYAHLRVATQTCYVLHVY
ncbi:MAG: hypothetical protein OS112_09775 [Methanoregula sp.]|nr:MAG: hypothetical protein OS112_09775 [Methanoregula sp.]